MEALFISHPDFANLTPYPIFCKELKKVDYPHPEELENKHIVYRKKFELADFREATIKITADDYYKLYINGKYVTEGTMSSYPQCYFYDEVDITDFLHAGENTFAVHTYYQGNRNHVWVSRDLRQMMWCSVSVDGEQVLVSDESWKCKYNGAFSSCGYFGYKTAFAECYDSSHPDSKILDADFDESEFVNAVKNEKGGWKLIKKPTKQLERYKMEPKKIEKIDSGIRVTLPTEAAGSLYVTAHGNRGDTVILHYGEELNDDGSLRFDMRANCRYEEKWILSGERDELNQYDYKAFRYAELYYPDNVEILEVGMMVRHYPYEQKAKYNIDDEKLAAVIELCANTTKYGTQEQYIDCPTREKGAYVGDAMVSGRAQAVLTRDLTLLKQVARNAANTAFVCPGLLAVSGSGLMQEIADYSLEYPALITWIYSIDKDIEFVKELEPCVNGVYEYFKKFENEDGLLDCVNEKWNLVDWPQNLRDGYDFNLVKPIGKGLHNVISAMWYGFKLALQEIYDILGVKKDVDAEKTKKAFIKTFYREETGLFADSETSNHTAVHSIIFPLLFGIGTDDETLKRNMINEIARKKLNSMGVYMAYFALAALKNAGEYELCKTLATDKDAWMNMLSEGATTTFEAWGKEQKHNTSLFHPWATAPIIIFSDEVRPY